MKLKKLSLRTRIFIVMIVLVLIASVLIAAVAIYQYNEETTDYHTQRLERKEENIKAHLKGVLNGRENTWEVKTRNTPLIFKDKIGPIAEIHKLQINLYDLQGNLLITSKADLKPDEEDKCIETDILNAISNTADHRYVDKLTEHGQTYQSSYTFIYDKKYKVI